MSRPASPVTLNLSEAFQSNKNLPLSPEAEAKLASAVAPRVAVRNNAGNVESGVPQGEIHLPIGGKRSGPKRSGPKRSGPKSRKARKARKARKTRKARK